MPTGRRMRIIAQDPGFRWPDHLGGDVVTVDVTVPYEYLEHGPRGARLHVIDYLIEPQQLLRPANVWTNGVPDDLPDPFENTPTTALLDDPAFHAQNVYALVSRTLARFEFALGRRMEWGFGGHQLKVVPHAFTDANAFYSADEQILAFGHFPGLDNTRIFTCLSHDIVVHETAHALLDGLRSRYTDPSSPDQAAFHEAFADLVALLSVLSTGEVVHAALRELNPTWTDGQRNALDRGLLHANYATAAALRDSVLGSIARQVGEELYGRGRALRSSAFLRPDQVNLNAPEWQEEHDRGEVLVAAVMSSYFDVLAARLETLGYISYRNQDYVDLARVVEEAGDIADYLLTMIIRAIDYAPPIHLKFADFLSAVLTADYEVRPNDTRYQFRDRLRQKCAAFGIQPAAIGAAAEPGCWQPANPGFTIDGLRFESFRSDPAEVMRFVWANRGRGPNGLALHPTAYTRIESVRPSVRTHPDDGFPLRETVAECTQVISVNAGDLQRRHGVTKPADLDADTNLYLRGGTTLIFDEFGRLKYDIHNHLPEIGKPGTVGRVNTRIAHLTNSGAYRRGHTLRRQIANLHRNRALAITDNIDESW